MPFGEPDGDRDRLAVAAAVRVADRRIAVEGLDGLVDVGLLDAVVFEAVLVDDDPEPFGRVAVGVVDVDDEGDALEGLADLRGDRTPRLGVGAVDLGEQRREHRRPRRRLDHLDRGARGHIEAGEALAEVERDGVARPVAFALLA